MGESKNQKLLKDFSKFCLNAPELRFWQALSAWTSKSIYVGYSFEDAEDTFYWTEKDGFDKVEEK